MYWPHVSANRCIGLTQVWIQCSAVDKPGSGMEASITTFSFYISHSFWFLPPNPFLPCISPLAPPSLPAPSPHSTPGMASILMSAVGFGVHFTSAPFPQQQQPAPLFPPPVLSSGSRASRAHTSSSSVRRAKRQHRRGSYHHATTATATFPFSASSLSLSPSLDGLPAATSLTCC